MLDQVPLDLGLGIDPLAVLRRDQDALDLDGLLPAVLVDLVPDRDLRLPVRPQIRDDPALANVGEPTCERVRDRDRQRHQLRRLSRRVTDHEALVAGADTVERIVVAGIVLNLEGVVDALRDVGRLLVDRDDDAARLRVEAVLRARVADAGDRPADEPRDIDVGAGRDLAADDDEAGRDERLARDAPGGVVGEDRVEDGVGDLVGDLVGVAFGDRFRADREGACSHFHTLAGDMTIVVTHRSACAPSARRRAPSASCRRARRRRPR